MSDERVFVTDRSTRIGLGIIFLGIASFGIAAMLDGAPLLGAAIFVAGVSAWLYYFTLQVQIGRQTVKVRRLWLTRWESTRNDVWTEIAMGGDLRTHRCVRLHSPQEAKSFEMLQSLFGKKAIEEVARMLRGQP